MGEWIIDPMDTGLTTHDGLSVLNDDNKWLCAMRMRTAVEHLPSAEYAEDFAGYYCAFHEVKTVDLQSAYTWSPLAKSRTTGYQRWIWDQTIQNAASEKFTDAWHQWFRDMVIGEETPIEQARAMVPAARAVLAAEPRPMKQILRPVPRTTATEKTAPASALVHPASLSPATKSTGVIVPREPESKTRFADTAYAGGKVKTV